MECREHVAICAVFLRIVGQVPIIRRHLKKCRGKHGGYLVSRRSIVDRKLHMFKELSMSLPHM